MKAESARFIEQAGIMLNRADVMLGVSLNEDAARAAYMACFHLAQAYIYERTNKLAKSHKGVQTEFFRLSKDDQRVYPELRRFLAQAYDYKSIADYFTDGEATISEANATGAIATAKRFVSHLTTLVATVGSPPGR